jgi:hypothetical protein
MAKAFAPPGAPLLRYPIGRADANARSDLGPTGSQRGGPVTDLPPAPPVDDPETLAAVTDAFHRYDAALVANDLDAIGALFWDSPLTVRYGTAENLYGAAAIAAFRAARPPGPRPRTLTHVVITTYGRDVGIANCEYRTADRVTIGRQSQTWIHMPEGWRIVSAHVSYMEA